MRVHPVATGGNDPRGTDPKDRLLAAFSAFSRANQEIKMLAVSAELDGHDDRAEALEETIRALHTAQKHLRVATRGWVGALTYDDRDRGTSREDIRRDTLTPRQVRDADKLAEAAHYLDGVRDTDGGE